jgi:peptide subunit release factor 1 (eRF1)
VSGRSRRRVSSRIRNERQQIAAHCQFPGRGVAHLITHAGGRSQGVRCVLCKVSADTRLRAPFARGARSYLAFRLALILLSLIQERG